MKKFLITLGIAIMASGILSAQITVNATDGINLGNAIKVTNNTIKINKKISSDGNLEFAPSDQIVFHLPKVGIRFCNVMDEYILSDPENGTPVIGAAGINPDLYTSGCIAPTLHNFMDLGEKGTMFRVLYVTQPVFGAMPKIKDLSGPKGASLQNAAQIIAALQPIEFTVSQKKKVGFSAKELAKVLPELVEGTAAEGYTIDYISLIPYLVQALKEEQDKRADLEKTVADMQTTMKAMQRTLQSLVSGGGKAKGARYPGNEGPEDETGSATIGQLYQNTPNPFSSATVIRYGLAENGDKAYIRITNANGRLMKDIALPSAKGNGQIEISAGELTPGLYTYSLVVAGMVVDSKRMVVTQ